MHFIYFSVPGSVPNFMAEAQFISVVFTWDQIAPENRNGMIIAYELTYRVNGSAMMMNVSSSTFVFSDDLDRSTNVTDISIRAYTGAGPGEARTAGNVLIPNTPTVRE